MIDVCNVTELSRWNSGTFCAAALKVEEKDNAATQNEVGWLQNESFVKTDSARYATFAIFPTDH